MDSSTEKQRKLLKAEDQHLKTKQNRKLSEVRTEKSHKLKQLKFKQEIKRVKKEFEH